MTLKIIGAGFGRTGTTSLKAALEELGFNKCYHMQEVIKTPAHMKIWLEAYDQRTANWEELFQGYQATVDWPACSFYQELMVVYPEAKVLLSVRDAEKWYNSCRNTVYGIYRKPVMRLFIRLVPRLQRFLGMIERMIWQGDFGGKFEDRQYAIAVYNQHNAQVQAHVPAERLLVYDVKEGWEPLCRFLNVPVPVGKDFPHLNDTKNFQRLFWVAYGVLGAIGLAVLGLVWWLMIRA